VSRLKKRVEALDRRQRPAQPQSPLKLLTTNELRVALALVERGGLLPNGKVLHPEVYQDASPREWEALRRWMDLCSEPLDHLEATEELLDRMGEAYGWRSPEAVNAALLRERQELPSGRTPDWIDPEGPLLGSPSCLPRRITTSSPPRRWPPPPRPSSTRPSPDGE
jgi:hypothetical protein